MVFITIIVKKESADFSFIALKNYSVYLKYKFDFVQKNDRKLLASVASLFGKEKSINNTLTNKGVANSIPVLLYHGIINEPDGANVLLGNFKNQMFALKKAGWQTIGIEDFYAFMKGEKNLPDKSFLLTFDDGAKNSYYPVDPILKALDYNAITFIITKYSVADGSGSGYYLSENELKKMIKSGRWDIQSHSRDGHIPYVVDNAGTKGNFFSNKLWIQDVQKNETEGEFRRRIYNDFVNSKNDLENAFEKKVISFAYPFGDFGQNSINFPEAENVILGTIKSVYPISFYQVWGGNPRMNYPQLNDEHLFIKRINVEPEWRAEDLLVAVETSREKDLPYLDEFKKNNGWIKTWGQVEFKGNSMAINAHASTTGSAVFLDGAYLWQNYVFKADVNLTKGQTFSLVVRYKDGKNYAMCSFSDKSIKIEQFLNGERKTLSELKGDFVFIGKNREAGIGVYGNTVDCYLDGSIAMKGYNLDQKLDHGGIGFKTWDSQADNSELAIKNVSVEETTKQEKDEFVRLAKIESLQENATKSKNEAISSAHSANKPNIETIISQPKQNIKPKTNEVVVIPFNLTDSTGSSTPYFVNNFSNMDNLKKIWGNYSIENGFLNLNVSTTSSSFLVFGGTSEWSDYLFRTKSDWGNNVGFSLVARYKDSKNYSYCSFSGYGKYASLYTVINGKAEKIGKTGELAVPYSQPYLNVDLSIQAKGDEVRCFVGDRWVLKGNSGNIPKTGGIGIKSWNTGYNDNKVAVKEINIEEIK